MNIVVLKNNFKEALNIVAGIKKENSQLPILKNILLKTEKGSIEILATDLEIGVTHKISGKVVTDGVVAIPYSVISQIISNLSFERITLESKGTSFLVNADNYKARITTAVADDFPIIPDISESATHFTIDTQILLEALQTVSVACQVSDFRPELSGILMHFKNGVFRVVATDSFRLAKQEIPAKKIKTDFEGELSCIIPLRTVQEIIRIFSGKKESSLELRIDDNQIWCADESTRIVSRRINGSFPDYEAVIPAVYDAEITVKKEDIVSALKLTSSLANRLFEVRFILDEDMKYIKLISSSNEFGEGEYLLPVKATGQKLEISFNWRFILDGIRNIKTESVFIGLNNEQKPSVIKITNDASYAYVLTSIKSN
jgi:DNA polymerase-3 subunit beta